MVYARCAKKSGAIKLKFRGVKKSAKAKNASFTPKGPIFDLLTFFMTRTLFDIKIRLCYVIGRADVYNVAGMDFGFE